MFNPYVPLTPDLLNAMVRAGKYILSGKHSPEEKVFLETDVIGSYLYTHYNDKSWALTHYGTLKTDPINIYLNGRFRNIKSGLLKLR
jgi:hypothetical protein